MAGIPGEVTDLGRALAGALSLDRPDPGRPALVAFVGAGGKTTLLGALQRALTERGWRVLVTTTTRIGADQVAQLPGCWVVGRDGDKLLGPGPDEVGAAWAGGRWDAVLVEADGARSRLVKAPAAHEPVIPSRATHVVAVLAADALDRVIAEVAHRPERVAAVVGCGTDEPLTAARAIRLATSPDGLCRGVPVGARFLVALTRVGPAEQHRAESVATGLAAAGIRVLLLPKLHTTPRSA